MTNLIWTMVGAYFLTGVLLWIKVLIKAAILVMNTEIPDGSYAQALGETAAETINEDVEEADSMTRWAGEAGLGILISIAAWPKFMQLYEECTLSTISEIIEKANRT